MATTTSTPPADRSNKRLKPDESQGLAPPPEHPYPPPGGPPPPIPPYGYPPPPYGYAPPPHPHWQSQQSPPYRGDYYGGRPKLRKKPDDAEYYNGYYPPPQYPPYVHQGTWTGSKRDDYSRHSEDDGASSSAGGSGKDKGRGSYKCGRVRSFLLPCRTSFLTKSQCGAPKKGHVCPYQPKLKRRPDDPPPETRNAAVQVEMDEFMTIRRLNLKLQGLPESYVAEPYELTEEAG